MKVILEVKYFIGYVLNYKNNVKELDDLTQKYDEIRSDVSKLKDKNDDLIKQKTFLTSRVDEHLLTIKEQRKEIRNLKKDNKFLAERDNKLQQIEMMFENKRVVLKDLAKIVKGG